MIDLPLKFNLIIHYLYYKLHKLMMRMVRKIKRLIDENVN